MQKNIDLSVRRVMGAYCLTLGKAVDDPQLFHTHTPYGEDLAPLGPFHGQEMWIPSPDPTRRLYFTVHSKDSVPLWAADTAVEIASVENFRDMGGYRTQNGRTVKWGRFFRSGPIAGMTESETRIYEGMGIRSIFDYREAEESAQRPDVYGPGTAYHLVPGTPRTGQLENMDMVSQLRGAKTEADAAIIYDLFLSMYDLLPFGNDAYRQMLAALDSDDAVPMVQHCSAGKDRTGVGCMLLLLSLGVDAETVIQDYLLSAIFREEVNLQYMEYFSKNGFGKLSVDTIARIFTVTREMLERAFAAIAKRYSSVDAFLEAEYGMTPARRAHIQALHTV